MSLFEVEIEFLKVFILGVFFGFQFRKYFYGIERKIPWTTIKNVKFSFMNTKHKI